MRASLVAQLVKNPPAMQETLVQFLGREDPAGEGMGYPLQYSWASLGGSDGKESTCNEGDLGSIPGLGRSPREGNGYALQYSCLENSMDRGAWQSMVHGVAKSWTRLGDFHFHLWGDVRTDGRSFVHPINTY